MTPTALENEYHRIERGGRLHAFHWFVVSASLLLTFVAWYTVDQQIQQKAQARFEQETTQVIELVTDRMARYEDAMISGVAAIHAQNRHIDRLSWRRYANSVDLANRLPGINGIGVIFHVPPTDLPSFLAQQRRIAPDFAIHPRHHLNEFWPITYIEPEKTNLAAIGLDMAHETNRFTAAKAARDTGNSQITAPIVLVQDARRTPGFLLFAPYYTELSPETRAQRQTSFVGMVYAPFIFSRLMEGVLASERRPVGVSIVDTDATADALLYNEFHAEDASYDPEPMFRSSRDVFMYGRTWRFDFATNQRFRQLVSSNESNLILAGGILIDSMLLALFIFLARSNRKAIEYARQATASLEDKTQHLERANEELSEFTYRTSHDLRSPLLSSAGLLDVAARAIEKNDTNKAILSLDHAKKSLNRLSTLIEDLLSISKAEHAREDPAPVELDAMIKQVLTSLQKMDGFEKVTFDLDCQLDKPLIGQPTQLERVLENIISNAIKYQDPAEPQQTVHIRASTAGESVNIKIEDNGLGIPAEHHAKMFSMFNRFHPRVSYGSGLGLYIVRKSVQAMGGEITYKPATKGSIFLITLPLS